MKKTLITLLAMAGVAMGTTAEFTSLTGTTTVNGITMTNGVMTATDGVTLYTQQAGTNIASGKTANIATTAVFITLDWTALTDPTTTRTENLKLVTFDTSTDIAFAIKPNNDFAGYYGNSPNGNAATMPNNADFFTGSDDHQYITLAVVVDATDSWGGYAGMSVIDSNGTEIYKHTGLGSSSNTAITSITFNTDYITWAKIDTVIPVNSGDVVSWAAAQIPASVPEPTTATLSLLALAGLAARRRRR